MSAPPLRLPCPVFGLGVATSRAGQRDPVILASGGGGKAKTGVKNTVFVVALDETAAPRVVATQDLGETLVTSMAVAPDRRHIACSVGAECAVYRFDFERRTFTLVTSMVTDKAAQPCQNVAAFNSDTTRLACGGEDGVVRLYSIMKDSRGGGGTAAPALIVTLSAELPGHTAPITDLVFAASGGLLASTSRDGTCRVWSPDDALHDGGAPPAAAVLAGNCAAVAGGGTPARAGKRAAAGPARYVMRACRFTADGQRLHTLETNVRGASVLATWARGGGGSGPWEIVKWVKATDEPASCMDFSEACNRIAVGVSSGRVALFDAAALVRLWDAPVAEMPVGSVAFLGTRAGPAIACGSPDGVVAVLRLAGRGRARGCGRATMVTLLLLLLALLVVLAAVWLGQQQQQP